MGGFRQFNTLLRKNVLLKTRRPRATCLEISMPLVLFFLLVWVRNRVEPEEKPSKIFNQREVFPLANVLARSLVAEPDSLLDINVGSIANDFEPNFSKQTLPSQFRERLACDSGSHDILVQGMKPLLNLRFDGDSLESHFLKADAAEQGERIRKALDEIYAYNMSNMIDEIELRRREYLESDWPRRIFDTAERIQSEVTKLRNDLDSIDGRARTRARVQEWTDDVCALRLPDLSEAKKLLSWEDVNGTTLGQAWIDLKAQLENVSQFSRDSIQDSEELWREIKNSTHGLSMSRIWDEVRSWENELLHLGENMTLLQDFKKMLREAETTLSWEDVNGTKLGQVWVDLQAQLENVSQFSRDSIQESEKLWSEIKNSTVGLSMSRVLDEVRSWETELVHLGENMTLLQEFKKLLEDFEERDSIIIDTSAFAQGIKDFQNMLEDSGIADWIRGNNVSAVMKPVRNMVADMNADDMAASFEDMADYLEDASASKVAEVLDASAWWLSHFLSTQSATARFLGEQPNKLGNMNWTFDSKVAIPEQLKLRTNMGKAVFQALKELQDDSNMEKLTDEVKSALNRMKEIVENHAGSTDNDILSRAESFISDLRKMMDDIVNYNSTHATIELPSWNISWLNFDFQHYAEEAKSALEEMEKKMRKVMDDDVDSIMKKWTDEVKSALKHMEDIVDNHTGSTDNDILTRAESFISDLRKMMDEIIIHNATHTTIELPSWNSSWLNFDFQHYAEEAKSALEEMEKNMRKVMDEDVDGFVQDNIANARSVLSDLEHLLDKIKNYTADDIEHILIPEWNESWQVECPRHAPTVVDIVDKTYAGCPFYRNAMRAFSIEDLPLKVSEFHDALSKFDVHDSLGFIRTWHSELKEKVKPADVDASVRRVWSRAQSQVRSDVPLASALATEIQGELMSGSMWNGRSITCERKLAEDDDSASIMDLISERKILVAPYKGEARQLFEFMLMEGVLSVTTANDDVDPAIPIFAEWLLRCPVVRALGAKALDLLMKDRVVTFDTESELEAYARKNAKDVLVALVFRSADAKTGNFAREDLVVDYAIRTHAQFLPPTSDILSITGEAMFGGVKDEETNPYIDFGFVYIQEILGRATARLRASRTLRGKTEIATNIGAANVTEQGRRLAMSLRQYPAPAYTLDRFIRYIQHSMPMIMIMGWIYAVSLLVKEIVYEKQEKLRDVMRIQGLQTWVYWASWFASAMIQMTVLVSLTISILFLGKVIQYSDPSLMFVFFMTYSMATVSLAMLISAFFSSAKVAAACGGLIYWLIYLPYSLFNRFEDVMSLHGKNAMCLLSSCGFGIGSAITAKWELIEEGATWSNFASPPPVTNSGAMPSDGFSLAHVMMMLLIDTVVYQVLAWYIEKVNPSSSGLPQPWYFPLMPSYWRSLPAMSASVDKDSEVEKRANSKLECWEAPPIGLESIVKIRGLTKIFKGGKKALNGITLDMHRGTILGLLGHNGAGKSTTMSILTGLYPPSDGDVQVNGHSVRNDSIGVRKHLGVCLQHNALYENITVEEHLYLFCCLKCVPWNQMKGAVEALLNDTGLMPKRHAPSSALSGGMKRKLSIGIAMSGGSQVVTLDEPTAGVDASSRREIWQFLASQRSNRSILLSTHFMDEADILSDRIAIIAEGELRAIGGSMFLKRHFADDYTLTIVAQDDVDVACVSTAVLAAVPEAKYVGSRGRELSYALPCGKRHHFAKLFDFLQDVEERIKLGIDTYGLSAATMEEVFLQASSVHESGLQGVVRNGNADMPRPQDTNALQQLHHSRTENSLDDGSTACGSDDNRNSVKSDTVSLSDLSADQLSVGSPELPPEDAKSDKGMETLAAQVLDQGPSSPHCMRMDNLVCTEPKISDSEVSQAPKKKLTSAAAPEDVERFAQGAAFEKSHSLLFGPMLWPQQFGALIRKRVLSVRRDRRAWASQLVLPSIFVFLALLIASILSVKVDEPALKLSTEMFIGSVSSSAVQTSLSEHIIPYADMRGDSWGKGMLKAFDAAKQSHDTIKVLDAEPNMATYLMDNHQALLMESYGAASTGGSIGSPNVTMWFKSRAVHSIPAMTSFYNNARLRMIGYDDAKTVAWSHPLPKTQALLSAQMSGSEQLLVDFTVAITVLLAMGFIPASFVVYVVNEKSTNSKHQQLLTGVSPTMYWTTNYFFDILNFIIPLLVCFTLFVGFQVDAYSGRNLLSVTLLLFTYGLCMTPCMYCVEPFFKVPSTAYVALICTNIFTGTITVMTTTVLDMVVADDPGLKPLNDFFKAVFPWFFPNFNLGRGMIDIAANHYVNFAYDEFGVCMFDSGCPRSPLSWDAGGRSIFHLLMMAPFWFLLRLFIEWGFCLRTCRQRAKEVIRGDKADWERSSDDAVNDEADRVLSSLTCKGERRDQLLIHKLSKTFDRRRMCCNRRKVGPTYAVRGLNVGVPRGECFGLLGVNGAGKTTTMRMITGDTSTDGGDVQICGLSVHGKRTRARQHLGYCPQFDALPDKLTTRETIALYARIRGIPSALVQVTVNESIKRMCLESHQNTTCEHLSGGNKRKLSTAIALIGEPDVVLLDEPSTGVDVGARRFLWDIIGDIRKRGHALVLTSHSMEECEVLCTRLTIMVAGQFRCLGTPTQLKAKYGDGYTLTIKGNLSDDTDCMSYINEFVTQRLPGAVLAEESVGLARYNISSETKISLASMFTILEHAAKEKGELFGWISDYAISQTSLEEVFLHFAQDPTTPHIQGKAVDGCAPPSKESQNMDDVPLPTTKPNPLHIDHEKLDKEPNAKLDEEPDALVFM